MKIFLDIGHPAHVHYFRKSIKILQEKGHEFLITARNKDVTIQLLDHYKIDYYNRGKGHGNIIGKILYLLKTNFMFSSQRLNLKGPVPIGFFPNLTP